MHNFAVTGKRLVFLNLGLTAVLLTAYNLSGSIKVNVAITKLIKTTLRITEMALFSTGGNDELTNAFKHAVRLVTARASITRKKNLFIDFWIVDDDTKTASQSYLLLFRRRLGERTSKTCFQRRTIHPWKAGSALLQMCYDKVLAANRRASRHALNPCTCITVWWWTMRLRVKTNVVLTMIDVNRATIKFAPCQPQQDFKLRHH